MNGESATFEPELSGYQKERHDDTLFVINVESAPAINNLDALLAVEDLDGVLIGPHDLSSSLGIPERYDAPEFEKAVQTIFSKARARKCRLYAGIHCWLGTHREIALGYKLGLNFIVHSADIIAMRERLSAEVREMRTALGDAGDTGKKEAENI